MIPEKVKKILKKQHYGLVGNHSGVQICRWAKKSIRGEGECYKNKFYGIKSHQCCQMTTSLFCPNQCLHCWRAIEFTTGGKIPGAIDSPKEIIKSSIKAQRKLIEGFKILPETAHKTLSKADMKKFSEAQEPMHFAISLSGEPTMYSKIGEFISELKNLRKTSFLVTNGLYPEKIKELAEKNQLPTQLYVSVNSPNKKMYDKFHRSLEKNAWKKLNETLSLMKNLKCRTVFRMNLIKNLNMNPEYIKEYAELIKKSNPMFIEIKGYMSVGFARERLGYERMPTHKELKNFAENLIKELKKINYSCKILDEHEYSRVLVLGKSKRDLKIKKREI